MIKTIIETQLHSGTEIMSLADFEYLANSGETNLIERKSIKLINSDKPDNLKEKISKNASAFSNYIGGCILFGIEDKSGVIEEGIDNSLNGSKSTIKEWLVDIVCTACTPLIKDYAIKIIPKERKYLFAIFFTKSTLAPHQANSGKETKNKYFYRLDGKSTAIDGILVRDIFNRNEYADLEVIPSLTPHNDSTPNKAILSISVKNISNIPAENVCLLFDLSENVINGTTSHIKPNGGQLNTPIIYPDLPVDMLGREKIKLKDFTESTCNFQIVAKNMRLKKSSFIFKKEGNNIAVYPIIAVFTSKT